MLFQSFEFAFFLAGAAALFFLVPGKMRPSVLLAANFLFFLAASSRAVPWLAVTILTTYGCGLLLERVRSKRAGGVLLAVCLTVNLGLLILFQYFPVWEDLINGRLYGGGIRRVKLDFAADWGLAAPLGISFYTLQALGYLLDVARKKYPAERKLLYFAVFVSFFPNLSSGPIERADHFLPQLRRISHSSRRQLWDYDRMAVGLIHILWGFFLKMVLADRAAVLVDHLFELYENTDSFTMLMAALFYSVQIFCDFASYSSIALGTAQLMGFSLTRNFRQPYLAAGFRDFWSRWHISLSSWLRDYIYIPLGGNRRGVLRRYGNILVTFLVSGLWHGGAPHFLMWGLLHGLCQVGEDMAVRVCRRCTDAADGLRRGRGHGEGERPEKRVARGGEPGGNRTALPLIPKCFRFLSRSLYTVFTFAAVTVLWIFFRAESLEMALVCLKNLFTRWQGFLMADQLIFVMGLDQTEFLIAAAGIALLLLFELISEWTKKPQAEWIYASPLPVRFLICLFLMGAVFVAGKYGVGFDASGFIYMGF